MIEQILDALNNTEALTHILQLPRELVDACDAAEQTIDSASDSAPFALPTQEMQDAAQTLFFLLPSIATSLTSLSDAESVAECTSHPICASRLLQNLASAREASMELASHFETLAEVEHEVHASVVISAERASVSSALEAVYGKMAVFGDVLTGGGFAQLSDQLIHAWCEGAREDVAEAKVPKWVEAAVSEGGDWKSTCEAVGVSRRLRSLQVDETAAAAESKANDLFGMLGQVPELMNSFQEFVAKEVDSLVEVFEPVREIAADLLLRVLPFRRATINVGDFLERLQGIATEIEEMVAKADSVIETAEDVHDVVKKARVVISDLGLDSLAEILGGIFEKALLDPECELGYHIPADWPALKADTLEIGYTFAELADVNSLKSAMGMPGILLAGLQRVLCMVRRLGATVHLLVDDYIISPMYDIMDLLAVGTWGDSRPPDCVSDHCLEIAQRSTGLW